MEDTTIIYIWSGRERRHLPVAACHAKCPECGAAYGAMFWDMACPGEPFLQCDCGEQFSTRRED